MDKTQIIEEKKFKKMRLYYIIDSGLYSQPPFVTLHDFVKPKPDWQFSFLIINPQQFYVSSNGTGALEFPKKPFDLECLPLDYGEILRLIKNGEVPTATAREYLKAFSLDGKFGKIADLGYLIAPDMEKLREALVSKNPEIQKQNRLALKFDQHFIDIVSDLVDAKNIIVDDKQRAIIMDRTHDLLYNLYSIAKFLPPETLANLDASEIVPLANRTKNKSLTKEQYGTIYFEYLKDKLDYYINNFKVLDLHKNNRGNQPLGEIKQETETLKNKKPKTINYEKDTVELCQRR